jgi:hypothetical protein
MSFIENNNLFIGCHIGFSKNMMPTIEYSVKYDMKSVQFFL